MKNFKFILIVFLFFIQDLAFGGSLMDAIKSIGNASQLLAPNNSNTSSPAEFNLPSDDVFCKKIQETPEFQEFSEYAKTIASYNIHFPAQHIGEEDLNLSTYKFDTQDNVLYNWIKEKFKYLQRHDQDNKLTPYLNSIKSISDKCTLRIKESNLLYLMTNDKSSHDRLKDALDKIVEKNNTKKIIRKIDESGNYVTIETKENTDLDLFNSTGPLYTNNLSNAWIPTLLVVLDPEFKLLKQVYPDIKANTQSIISRIDDQRKSQREFQERETKAKQAEENARKKEVEEQEKKRVAYNNLINSPAGKLQIAYEYLQIISACVEIRKGMAAVYISPVDYSKFKDRVKALETKMTPILNGKNKTDIWNDAVNSNRNVGGTDNIEIVKNASFSRGQQLCSAIAYTLNDHLDSILGKEALKKDF